MYLRKIITYSVLAGIALTTITGYGGSKTTDDTTQNTTTEESTIETTDEKETDKPQEIHGPFAEILKKLSPTVTKEALLIGVVENGKYKTYYVEYADGKAERTLNIPALAVPQKDGFWYFQSASQQIVEYATDEAFTSEDGSLEMVKTIYKNNHIYFNQDLNKVKDSVKSHLSKIKKGKVVKETKEFNDYSKTMISFASGGYITFHEEGNGYTGGAHGYNYENDFSLNFENLKKMKALPSYGKWSCEMLNNQYKNQMFFEKNYSKKELDIIKKTLYFKGIEGRFVDRQDQSEKEELFDLSKYKNEKIGDQDSPLHVVDVSQMDFIMQHRNGSTKFSVQADASASYAESGDYTLTTEYLDEKPISNKIIPFNESPISFEAIKAIDSEIVDIYMSPKHNVLFIKKADALTAIEVSTGKQLIELPISGNVVMIEWAVGDYTEQWRDILQP